MTTLRERAKLGAMVDCHLRYNHFPAAPSHYVPIAVAVVEAMRAGEPWGEIEVEVDLGNGTVTLPRGQAPAFIEAWHLEEFMDDGEEDEDG